MVRLLACVLLLAACASKATPPEHSVHTGPTLTFLRSITNVLKIETAVCVYGTVSPDTIAIEFLRPAHVDSADATKVYYKPCNPADTARHGMIRYLGMFHNHPPVISECGQSAIDRWSFAGDTAAVLDMIGCKDSVVIVQKRRR